MTPTEQAVERVGGQTVWHDSLPIQVNWTYAISPDDATEAHIYCPGNAHPWRMATIQGPDGEQTEAYATLIASAPDLLAALTLAEDVLSRFPFTSEIWPDGTHPNAGIEQIRAALSRATGGAG